MAQAAYNDVFISYSRQDSEFAKKFVDALYHDIDNIWVDWEDIEYAENWWERICRGIESASTFVFIISPDSVQSDVCRREIQHAVETGKRIVPILHKDVLDADDQKMMHTAIQRHNWLPFRDTDPFEKTLRLFLETIRTDPEHVKIHTNVLTKALEWDNADRDESRLLTGASLREAELWQSQAAGKSPRITQLHADFIYTSHQKQRGRSTRLLVGGGILVAFSLIAAVIASVLFFIAMARGAEAIASSQEARGLASIAYSRVAEEAGDFHVVYPLLLQANDLAGDNSLVLDFFMETNASLLLSGGFSIVPSITDTEDTTLNYLRTEFNPDNSRAAVIHRREVQTFDETTGIWEYYIDNMLVSLWDIATSTLIQENIIPNPEIDLASNESFVFNAPLTVDVEQQRAFILYEIERFDEQGLSTTSNSILRLWNLETGQAISELRLSVDDLALTTDETLLSQNLYYRLDRQWVVSQQTIVNETTSEISTEIAIWDIETSERVASWRLSGEFDIAANQNFVYWFNQNTTTMTQVSFNSLAIVHELPIQDLLDVDISTIHSVNFVNQANQAVILFEHSAAQNDLLVLELERLIARRSQTTLGWVDRSSIGDTIENVIYFPDPDTIFFSTEIAINDSLGGSSEPLRVYMLWNLATSEAIFTEVLENNQILDLVQVDSDTGWLLLVTSRQDQGTQQNFFTVDLQLYDTLNNFEDLFSETIDEGLFDLGFAADSFWWISDETLYAVSSDDLSACDRSKRRCERAIDSEIYNIPAGLSFINFDPVQEFVILHNRSREYFYQLNLNQESDFSPLELPANFSGLIPASSNSRISDNRYVALRYDARSEAYISFAWNAETLAYETFYYYDSLPVNNAGSLLVIGDGGASIFGLSSTDEETSQTSLLDVNFVDGSQTIPFNDYDVVATFLDNTEQWLLTFGQVSSETESETFDLRLLDAATYQGESLLTLSLDDETPIWVDFSVDGSHVAYTANLIDITTDDEQNTVSEVSAQFWIWETNSRELVYNPRLNAASIDFVFAPDQPLIYALMSNGDLIALNYETEEQSAIGTLNTPINTVGGSMSMSPDGSHILIIDNNRFFLWDVAAAQATQLSLFADTETILSAVFVNNEQVIFELSDRIVVWDVIAVDQLNAWVCDNRLVLPLNAIDLIAYELESTVNNLCAGD